MRRLICILMILLLAAACTGACALTFSAEEIDRLFTGGIRTEYKWERQVYSDGGGIMITEETTAGGHSYTFRVMGDADAIHEISLNGWYEDLHMNEPGLYPQAWDIYLSFADALRLALPDGEGLMHYLDGYDAYGVLENGTVYGEFDSDWYVAYLVMGRLELSYAGGGYITFSSDENGYYHLTYTIN